MVREPPKRQLADDRPGKGDIADILLCVGVLVQVAVLQAKHGGDGADDLQRLNAAPVSDKNTKLLIPPTAGAWRMQAKSGGQVSTADRTAQVGALTLLMYPSENRPAPQAMTGTIAFRNGWRGASTGTASCWAEVSDSADFFLRKLSMMRLSAQVPSDRGSQAGDEREKGASCEKQLKGEEFQGAASQGSQGGVDRVFIRRVITSPSGRHAQKGRSEPFSSIPSLPSCACPHLPTSAPTLSLSYSQTEAALACEGLCLIVYHAY